MDELELIELQDSAIEDAYETRTCFVDTQGWVAAEPVLKSKVSSLVLSCSSISWRSSSASAICTAYVHARNTINRALPRPPAHAPRWQCPLIFTARMPMGQTYCLTVRRATEDCRRPAVLVITRSQGHAGTSMFARRTSVNHNAAVDCFWLRSKKRVSARLGESSARRLLISTCLPKL